jgi:MerR family transcriptional regulator, light-induced transcriptional regulator
LTPTAGLVILAPVTVEADDRGARLDAYLRALLDRRTGDARAEVDAALAGGMAVQEVYLDVLAPALHQVGHRWAVGEVNVAEEHYATEVTRQVLDELAPRMRVQPTGGRLAIVTGSPGEQHVLGARMVADFLEADGWEVLQLGASTPAADLAQLAADEAPDVIALSTATARSLPEIADVLGRLTALRPRPLLAVGGQVWTAESSRSARDLGADLVATDPRMLVATLRERVPPRD